MATNSFKRYTKSSVNTSSAGSASAVYTVPSSGSAMKSIVIGITLANKTSSGVTASVYLDAFTGSDATYIVKDASIPAGSSLEIMSGNKLVVQGNGTLNDVVRVSSNTATAIDATISVLEDV